MKMTYLLSLKVFFFLFSLKKPVAHNLTMATFYNTCCRLGWTWIKDYIDILEL